MHKRRTLGGRVLWLLAVLVGAPTWAAARSRVDDARSPRADRTTWDSVFTSDQATRGQTAYNQTCARCHRETLAGGDEAPALTGSAFMSNWNGVKLEDLHDRIRTTMPTDTPGVYSRAQVTDVLAYMLKFNGFPAGNAELTHENEALKGIRFVAAKPEGVR
jgi:mono/diheme cytochrome c family protein